MLLPGARRYPVAMTDIFDAIADPARREILRVLRERLDVEDAAAREATAAQLSTELGLTPAVIARHIGVLDSVGLLVIRTEGQKRFFSLESTPLDELEEWLVPFFGTEIHYAVASDDGSSAVFAAWSGADVSTSIGGSIGRAFATGSHQARAAIHEASEKLQDASGKVARALPKGGKRKRGE